MANGGALWSPREGLVATGVVAWETTSVGSSLAEDTLEGMFKRMARGMFPMSKWRGPLVLHGLPGGRPAIPFHRQLRRRGGLSPPLPWPPFPDIACPIHVIVGWNEHVLHSGTLLL